MISRRYVAYSPKRSIMMTCGSCTLAMRRTAVWRTVRLIWIVSVTAATYEKGPRYQYQLLANVDLIINVCQR